MSKKGEYSMKECRLTITTQANGEENSIIRKGKILLSPLSAQIIYCEENAKVHLKLENNTVFIEREGDYTLSLFLEDDKQTVGKIGIGGSTGKIDVYANKVAYSISKDSVLLSLHYNLLFGEEKQEIKLRLLARIE